MSVLLARLSSLLCGAVLASLSFAEVDIKPLLHEPIPWGSLHGKWVFINYWASWCESCLNEIHTLNRFYAANKSQVAVFNVNYEQLSEGDLTTLVRRLHIHYPTLGEDPADTLNLGDITVLPLTFVFNPKGQLVQRLYGEQNQAQLIACMRQSTD